jgi:hypothetical protein
VLCIRKIPNIIKIYTILFIHIILFIYIILFLYIINQCCPNRCLSTLHVHSDDPDSGCTSCTDHCTVFLSHVWATHSASPVARSLFRPRCMFITNLQCTFQALQHSFFSKFFHIGFTLRPVTKKQKVLLDMDTIRASLHFCFVPVNICSRWLPSSLFLPGIPLQLSRLPLLLFFHKTCLILPMFGMSRQQQPLRSSFAPTMKRNWPSGSASSRHSLPQRASNRRNSGMPMLWPACPSKFFILDKETYQPSDLLKEVLFGQFGKSKWQSYFKLLRLPIEMQGLKPSVLMGKLKPPLNHLCPTFRPL